MADGGKVIIKIDGDDKGLKKTTDHIRTGFGKAASISKTAAKGIAAGVGAAAAAIGAIGTQAVKAYADYEQLVGGVETLFKQNADVVQNYANQAYQTAGMSANQYMETVTSFSASLLQSLGGDTAKAAEYGNQAVIDMSDNANKMGTSIDMIQNAYQGFAKQNYTMLDNLKLGYGGTKEEMVRLLKDAEKISGIHYDVSSFADITQAIHVIQTEMGITGTTAEEAATTIQGSLGMVKASWENLMTGLANPNADIDLLIDNVINSVMTFGENLMPVIQAVLDKIPIMIDVLGGVIMQKIPEVISTVLPELVNAASNLISTLANSLNTNAEILSDTAVNILMTLVNAIISNLPVLLNTAMTLILTLEQGIGNALPGLIPAAVDMILQIVDTFLDNIDMMVDTAISLIMGLADGLIDAIPILIEKAPEIVQKLVDAIIDNAPRLLSAAGELISKLIYGIITNIPGLIAAAGKIVLELVRYLKWYFTEYIPSVGAELVKGIWDGIKNSASWLWSKLKQWCGDLLDKVKGFFGIHSPSRVMRDEVGAQIVAGIAVGINENGYIVTDAMERLSSDILESELSYLDEKARIEAENAAEDEKKREKQYREQLSNAKDAAERKKIMEEERLRKKKAADDAYLAQLKEAADAERKIVDDLKKDITKLYDDIADRAEKNIDEVVKNRESFAEKLKDYVNPYTEKTTTFKGLGDHGEDLVYADVLLDLSGPRKQLEEYANLLRKVEQMEIIPRDMFKLLRDLPIDDAVKYADALLSASDSDLAAYVEDWTAIQKFSEDAGEALFGEDIKKAADDTAQYMKETLEKAGFEVPEGFFTSGSISAEKFGDGFVNGLDEVMSNIREKLKTIMSEFQSASIRMGWSMVPEFAASPLSGGTTYNNTTYNLLSSGESVRQQIQAIDAAETVKKMRGM